MPINDLIDKYCVTRPAPRPQPGETVPLQSTPAMMGNHRAEALVDGIAYFRALDQEITSLLASTARNRFFYLSAWWLGLFAANTNLTIDNDWRFALHTDAFVLPGSNQSLLTRLAAMAQAGINVRVMAWVSPFITNQRVAEASGIGHVNFHTLMSADALRKLLPSPEHVLLNVLAHSLGAAHYKMAVCGDQNSMRAYVSGLDPVTNRLRAPGAGGGWHDVSLKVEGSAAGSLHDFYRSLWNEQLARPVDRFNVNSADIVSHDPAWPQLIAREPISLPANTGRQYVQVLRTVPQMNFNESGPRRRGALLVPDRSAAVQIAVGTFANLRGFRRPRFSFAPAGAFEFKVALRQAISAAEQYIFIADQSLYALEVMDWVRDRLLRKPDLKVILFYGADPADPPSNFLAEAINNHLTPGLPQSQPVRLNNVVFKQWDNNTVHCKVTIVDDTWCAVGSANCMRRSLYTDIECSVGVIEEPTPAAQLPRTWAEEQNPAATGRTAPSFVQRFRRDLWAHYCGIPLDPAARSAAQHARYTLMLDLSRALRIWQAAWGGPPIAGVALRPEVSQQSLTPFSSNPRVPFRQIDYDRTDPDSRQPF